ncbi:MAG: CoA transferase [Rhodococcus sp. (in: high G+C Gram-positive bacteria)]
MDEASMLRDYQSGLGVESVADIGLLPMSDGILSSRLTVASLATGSIAAVYSAVDRFLTAADLTPPDRTVVGDRVAASFAGDRMLRIHGEPVAGFAELSGFFPAADGWVRTHANYEHHRRRLSSVLGLPDTADREQVSAALARCDALDIEERAARAGALVIAVRTESEWAASAPGRFARTFPVVSSTVRPDGASSLPDPPTDPDRPLAGIRVLDLTRVIAGPVAARDLALLGASVLRVDSPALPELGSQHLETGAGKYSTLLDVLNPDEDERLAALMSSVDVVVSGYRPGSYIDEYVRTYRPGGAIVGTVNAWGSRGPWARRRGFDSLVQAASGIADLCGHDGVPGALPVQALDHASGHLLAAGIVDALALRQDGGIGRTVSVSLARTAAWLLDSNARVDRPETPILPGPDFVVTDGDVSTARPALAEYQCYPWPARAWGQDQPRFPS